MSSRFLPLPPRKQSRSWIVLAAGALISGTCWALDPGALPKGSGAGVFDPNSQFAPLQVRSDVVPWSVLTEVKTRTEKTRVLPIFTPQIQNMNGKPQRVQGYMMPLDPGERQTHFLLASVPLTCPFCLPGGPESMVEVKSKTAVAYSFEPIVMQGRFEVLADDPSGLYYRMVDAVSVK